MARRRIDPPLGEVLDLDDMRNSLKSLMWRCAGLERDEAGLSEAQSQIDFWSRYALSRVFTVPAGWELQNMLTLSALVARSARERTESRGVHYRTDFPVADDARWCRRLAWSVAGGMREEPLAAAIPGASPGRPADRRSPTSSSGSARS